MSTYISREREARCCDASTLPSVWADDIKAKYYADRNAELGIDCDWEYDPLGYLQRKDPRLWCAIDTLISFTYPNKRSMGVPWDACDFRMMLFLSHLPKMPMTAKLCAWRLHQAGLPY